MRRSLATCLLAAAILAVACGTGRSPAPMPTAPSPADGPVTPPASVCAPASSAPPGPITDPNGPYGHRVAAGRLDASTRVTGARHVLEHASVPDGVRAPDGRVLVYYVNGEDGSVWAAQLAGDTAAPLGPIVLNGVPRPQGVVDPDAFLVGGRIRLAYLAGFGPPSASSTRAICLAESSDGVHFTALGVALAFTGPAYTDPTVVRLRDGRWLMGVADGTQTLLARSSDGVSFVSGERLPYGSIPELTLLDDGRVRVYVCARGIESYIASPDASGGWTFESTVVSGMGLACDPSHVAGTDVFLYKTGY